VIAQIQSALAPSSPPARSIDTLWWLSFWISVVVFALVVIALLWGAFRRRHAADYAPIVNVGPERRTATLVAGAVAVTLVILIVWLAFSVSTGRALTRIPTERPLTIQVIGHQWWWEVNYPDTALPNQRVTTANEIHVPVGRTVLLELTASDVIHSFWAPNLNGKRRHRRCVSRAVRRVLRLPAREDGLPGCRGAGGAVRGVAEAAAEPGGHAH
jgi:cytochrome c oxidase subunit 2